MQGAILMNKLDEIINKYLKINEGASTFGVSFDGKMPKDKLEKEGKKMQAEDDNEENDGYTGGPATFDKGLKYYISTVHKDLKSARDFLERNHKKGDTALAVRYIDKKKEHWLVGGWAAE